MVQISTYSIAWFCSVIVYVFLRIKFALPMKLLVKGTFMHCLASSTEKHDGHRQCCRYEDIWFDRFWSYDYTNTLNSIQTSFCSYWNCTAIVFSSCTRFTLKTTRCYQLWSVAMLYNVAKAFESQLSDGCVDVSTSVGVAGAETIVACWIWP